MDPDKLDAILAVCARHKVAYLKTADVELRIAVQIPAMAGGEIAPPPINDGEFIPTTYEELRKAAIPKAD